MKLTLRQKKLLYLLSINCRFTNKDIANALRISEDAVAYQINKLIHEEKLGRFNVQFDYFRLGYKQHHVWIKLQDKQDLSFLKKIPEIISINTSFGKYDLQLVTLTKTKKAFTELISRLKKTLKTQEIKTSEFTGFYKRFTNIMPPIREVVSIPSKKKIPTYDLNTESYAAPQQGKIKLDKTDQKIIRQLLQNPRQTYQEIARETGLNHETVRYRINGYIRDKFILNFGIIHDFKKYGLYTNYLLLKFKKPDDKKISRILENNQHVFYAAKLKGEYDAIVYLVSSNPKDFGRELSAITEAIDGQADLLFLDELHKYVQFPTSLSQEARQELTKIIDFDNKPVGEYDLEQVNTDWNSPQGVRGVVEGRCSIAAVAPQNHEKSLRVTFPKGTVGPEKGGARWRMKLEKPSDELYVQYKVMFPKGFDFVKGGKLPGLGGGTCPVAGKIPDGTDGFTARIMWRENGTVFQYLYYMEMARTKKAGENLPLNARFVPGKWHTLKTRVKMNTPGKKDGLIVCWLDGKLVLRHNLMFRAKNAKFGIDSFIFTTFFGGNTSEWAPVKDESIYFDEFIISTKEITT